MAKDELGNRMKSQYEDRTRYLLPRRTNTIIRVDGKAFHTFTRHSKKPFDYELMKALANAAIFVCDNAIGVRCAYGQSDEYSFLLQDYANIQTEAWFDGNVQKICSVTASLFTSAFMYRAGVAQFDARVFTIPDIIEVENYFIWRQQDATRNAILMAGYSEFSAKQMHEKNVNEVQEMLFQERGINFNDYPIYAKRGQCIIKDTFEYENAMRSRWVVDSTIPVFTQDRNYFKEAMRLYPDVEEQVEQVS